MAQRRPAAPPLLAAPRPIIAAYVLAEVAAYAVNLGLAAISGTGLQLAEASLTPALALLSGGLLVARGGVGLRRVAAWPGWWWAAGGVMAGAALKVIGDAALSLETRLTASGPVGNNPLALQPNAFQGVVAIALLALAAVVAAPLAEELFFRGLLYGWLRTRWRWPAAALVASVVFAAAHGNWELLLPLFLAGIGLCWLYERSGSLWPSVLAHATLNAVAVVAALVR